MQFSDINVIDPYKLPPDEYKKTMSDIKFIAENINFDEMQ